MAKDQQGKKLGLKMIQALDYVAEKVGCYKVSGPRRRVSVCEAIHLTCDRAYSTVPRQMRASM